MRILLPVLLLFCFTPVKGQNSIGSSRQGGYGDQDIYLINIIDPQLYGIWREESDIYGGSGIILFDTNRIVVYAYDFERNGSYATEYTTFMRKGDCYFIPHNSDYIYLGTFSAGRFVYVHDQDLWNEFEKINFSEITIQERAAILNPGDNYRIKTKDKTEYRIYDYYECHCDEPTITKEADTAYSEFSPIITFDDRNFMGRKRRPQPEEKKLSLEINVAENPFQWPEQEVTCHTEKTDDGYLMSGPCKDHKPQLKITNISKDTLYLPIPSPGVLCSAEMTLIKDNGDTLNYFYGYMDFLGSRNVRYFELVPGDSMLLETGFCFEESDTPRDKNGWSKPEPLREKKKKAITGVLDASFTVTPKMEYGPKKKYWSGKVEATSVEVKF